MTAAIEIQGLRKTFRSTLRGTRLALDGFDMVVESGQVHGFLGPNGSGKTTTLRALLGLVRADAGVMRVLGAAAPADLPGVAHRVGAIVESPQFFGNFTGRRTLGLLAAAGGVPAARVDEVLEQVGLRDRAGQRVRTYSLGMKQRLAVASALLKAPDLLILDEPANGMDPAGMRQMRDLMRGLAAAGVTVLVSSHLLAEIEQVCDSVTIISRGRRVTTGPVGEVLAGHDKGEFRVRVTELDRAAAIIEETGLPVTRHPDHFVVGDLADPTWISETLGRQGLWVAELTPLAPNLESVFLQLTATAPGPGGMRQVDDAVLPPRSGRSAGELPGIEVTAAQPERPPPLLAAPAAHPRSPWAAPERPPASPAAPADPGTPPADPATPPADPASPWADPGTPQAGPEPAEPSAESAGGTR